MGFLFSSDPDSKFDGLLVKSTPYSTDSFWEVVFIGADLYTEEKNPFKDGRVPYGLTKIEKESANDWNITAEKSYISCP